MTRRVSIWGLRKRREKFQPLFESRCVSVEVEVFYATTCLGGPFRCKALVSISWTTGGGGRRFQATRDFRRCCYEACRGGRANDGARSWYSERDASAVAVGRAKVRRTQASRFGEEGKKRCHGTAAAVAAAAAGDTRDTIQAGRGRISRERAVRSRGGQCLWMFMRECEDTNKHA